MVRRGQAFDIIVAGAGPVGLLFAFRLMRDGAPGARIRIVDAGQPAAWQAKRLDPRVYALSRESQWLFGELWSHIVERRVSPYRCMRVWEGETPDVSASVMFDAAEVGEPDLGHIVEDSLLRSALLEALGSGDTELSFGTAVESIAAADRGVDVTLSDGTRTRADLVVGADGADSRVRAAVGIEAVRKDYIQRAVVSHVATERPHAETAWQRFLPEGPLAFLPLADGRSSIVWTNSEQTAARLLTLDDDAFAGELEAASGGALGRIESCTKRLAFPLRLTHAVRYSQQGVALIGDAAHAVHPLAGQGMNLGLRDAAALAATITLAIAQGEYPADERVLRRYERAQKAHNLAMQLAFDGINELFGPRLPAWAVPIRGLGMAMVNGFEPAKRVLMRRALGLDRVATSRDFNGHKVSSA